MSLYSPCCSLFYSLSLYLPFFLVFLFFACTLFHSLSIAHSRIVQTSVFSRASKNYDRYFLTQHFNLSLSLSPSPSLSLSFPFILSTYHTDHWQMYIPRAQCVFNFLKKRNETCNRGTCASS